MDRSVLQAKKALVKSRPAQLVSKSVSVLMDVDTRVIETLSDEEKAKLSSQIEKLSSVTSLLKAEVNDDIIKEETAPAISSPESKRLLLGEQCPIDPIVYVEDANKVLTNMVFTLSLSAVKCCDYQNSETDRCVFFADENHNPLSELQNIHITVGERTKVTFTLVSSASELSECYLVIKSPTDEKKQAQQLMRFKLDISFSVGIDF